MSEPRLLGDAVDHYLRHAAGLAAIAFTCTVKHAQLVADQFKAAGVRAASVDGNMHVRERDRIIGGLASGELQVVTSRDLISEGLDIPARLVPFPRTSSCTKGPTRAPSCRRRPTTRHGSASCRTGTAT
jgi:Helicase conserved C-terminal domain